MKSFILSTLILSSVLAFADGGGPPTSVQGFTRMADGQYYGGATSGQYGIYGTGAESSGDMVSMSTHNVVRITIIDTDWAGYPIDIIAHFSNGRSVRVKFEGGRVPRDYTVIPPMNFLPLASPATGKSYNFYAQRNALANNTSDSYSPLGMTVYSGPTCNGTCRKLIGNLDSVAQDEDGLVLSGWACDRLVNKSLEVKAFFGAPRGQDGVIVGAVTADQKRWDSKIINGLCGTSNSVGHRFRIKVPQYMVDRHRGEKIYVHATTSSDSHDMIRESGNFKVPTVRIKGRIAEVALEGKVLHIRGWACNEGVNRSVQVRVFAGGPAGIGEGLAAKMANEVSGSYVSDVCGTSIGRHRFDISLTKDLYEKANGRFWVHGISLINGPNNALIGSGDRFDY